MFTEPCSLFLHSDGEKMVSLRPPTSLFGAPLLKMNAPLSSLIPLCVCVCVCVCVRELAGPQLTFCNHAHTHKRNNKQT